MDLSCILFVKSVYILITFLKTDLSSKIQILLEQIDLFLNIPGNVFISTPTSQSFKICIIDHNISRKCLFKLYHYAKVDIVLCLPVNK